MDEPVNVQRIIALKQSQAAAGKAWELWRRVPGDPYSSSIHYTVDGRIRIACGELVVEQSVERWIDCALAPGVPSQFEIEKVRFTLVGLRNLLKQVRMRPLVVLLRLVSLKEGPTLRYDELEQIDETLYRLTDSCIEETLDAPRAQSHKS